MVITVTSLKLRRPWYVFRLYYLSFRIVAQTKQQQGFISMKNTGFGYWYYTLSVWESEADVKQFARTGAHLHAMKQSRSLSTEISTYTFQSNQIPNWKEAKQLLLDNGKRLSF